MRNSIMKVFATVLFLANFMLCTAVPTKIDFAADSSTFEANGGSMRAKATPRMKETANVEPTLRRANQGQSFTWRAEVYSARAPKASQGSTESTSRQTASIDLSSFIGSGVWDEDDKNGSGDDKFSTDHPTTTTGPSTSEHWQTDSSSTSVGPPFDEDSSEDDHDWESGDDEFTDPPTTTAGTKTYPEIQMTSMGALNSIPDPTDTINATVAPEEEEMTEPEKSDDPVSNSSAESEDSGSESVCVSEEWLIERGYARSDFVHHEPIVEHVLCPDDAFSALPCGTKHHAVALFGELMSYRQLCDRVRCSHSMVRVNSLWAFHRDSARGIDVGLASRAQLFMHDTRYPRSLQVSLHYVLYAARTVGANAKAFLAFFTFSAGESLGGNAPVCF